MTALDTAKELINSRIAAGSPGSITASKLQSTLLILCDAIIADRVAANVSVSPSGSLTGENLQDLVDEVATLLDAAAPLESPALTGTPTAPTASVDVSSTQIATTAFVQNRVAALVDSAPDVLDTLSEISEALGNDENFSATVMTAIAAKAPLDSPDLTGTPTAPTQSAGDNSTRIATTEYVDGAVSSGVPDATTDTAGKVELATNAEALAGSDTTRAVTSAGLASATSLASDGYMMLPGGLILQWGTGGGSNTGTETFPTAFPTECVALTFGLGAGDRVTAYTSLSASQFAWSSSVASTGTGSSVAFRWIAVGY